MNDQPSNNNFPDKELADLWKRQETPMANTANPLELAQLTTEIKAHHRKEQVRLLWLNIREIAATVLATAFFAYLAVVEDAGRTLLIFASLMCAGIGVFLGVTSLRQRTLEQQFDETLRGSIEKSLSQAQHRFRMYRSSWLWYFTPLAVSMAILFAVSIYNDPNGAKPSDAIVIVLIAVLLFATYLFNRRIAFKKWKPEIDRFEALLADLDE